MKELVITAIKVMVLGSLMMGGLGVMCFTLTLIPQAFGRVMGLPSFDPALLPILVPVGLFVAAFLLTLGATVFSKWMGYKA